MKQRNRLLALLSGMLTLAMGVGSCVEENQLLGYGVIPTEEHFITRTVSMPITDVYLSQLDSMSGYSSTRMTVGAIRDTTFGTTRRGACIALVPLSDTLNWGHNVKVRGFHFTASSDSISYRGTNNASIIQQIRVYAMTRPIDSTLRYSCEIRNSDFKGQPSVCKGIPTYNGGDSLSFDLTEEFAKTYIPAAAFPGGGSSDVVEIFSADSIQTYKRRHKGIYICTDDPVGNDGRINLFGVEMEYDDNYYVCGNYAVLNITADYGSREQVDTSILFCFCPTDFDDEGDYYSFNTCETEYISGKTFGEPVLLHGSKQAYRTGERINVEGGVGYKPVILASHLKDIFRSAVDDTLRKYGYANADSAFASKKLVINKATMSLFYDMPPDYTDMSFYPQVMNPTLRVNTAKKDTVVYGSLTDASISDENQGTLDRFNCCYRPDITHHLQETLSVSDDSESEMALKDVWFLILASETIKVESSSSDSDYYTQMAYLNYYNSMMSGSYGYNSYSNYYNYYMMQAYYSSLSSGDSYTTVELLDTDRYYNAVLVGPSASSRVPKLEVTYSFLRR